MSLAGKSSKKPTPTQILAHKRKVKAEQMKRYRDGVKSRKSQMEESLRRGLGV